MKEKKRERRKKKIISKLSTYTYIFSHKNISTNFELFSLILFLNRFNTTVKSMNESDMKTQISF